jgi:hypothetical protein
MNLTRKVQESNMTEKEYRALPGRISSSDIRTFIQSRKKFYKSCILGERVPNDDTVSTILGSIADCVLTCPEEMDNKFTISVSGVPAGQLGELANNLYKRSLKTINAEGVQTSEFVEMFTEVVQTMQQEKTPKFKGKTVEKVVEMFTNPDKDGVIAELYYREQLAAVGKIVVSVDMLASGEKLARELQESPYTSAIVNQVSGDGIDVYKQLIVLFMYKDIQMRAMLDITIVDHNKKTVQPADVKTTYDNEGFDKMYIKGLYIQAAVYDAALQKFCKDNGLIGYEVLPMKYPVADTANENMPLLYQLTNEDIKKAYSGFRLKGSNRWFPGFDECIEDIAWAVETGNWKISRKAYQKGGKLFLEFDYQ